MDELSRMNGYQLVDELVAWMRQLCFVQAKLYETMTQIAHLPIPDEPTGPDSPVERSEFPEEFAVDELRVALYWTKTYACNQMGTALRLVRDLPEVHRALKAGRIQPRVGEVLANDTMHLQPAEAAEVADKVLADIEKAASDSDGFGGLTTGQVRARLRKYGAEADPEAAKKRYSQGVENRRFVTEQNPDGTAEVMVSNAPADRAARIKARVQATAEQIKRHGLAAGRTMDQIRADVALDQLEGIDPLTEVPTTQTGGAVEVTIPFDTLVGLADKPGELGGWGPVLADVARQVVERQRNGRWSFSVTDPKTGELLDQVLTRRRPPAEMARFVRARDKTCRNPACRAPASRCDLDHSIATSDGGLTYEGNLGPECRHDHRVKHEAGWRQSNPNQASSSGPPPPATNTPPDHPNTEPTQKSTMCDVLRSGQVLYTVSVDCANSYGLATFWSQVTGWPVSAADKLGDDEVRLLAPGPAPDLLFIDLELSGLPGSVPLRSRARLRRAGLRRLSDRQVAG